MVNRFIATGAPYSFGGLSLTARLPRVVLSSLSIFTILRLSRSGCQAGQAGWSSYRDVTGRVRAIYEAGLDRLAQGGAQWFDSAAEREIEPSPSENGRRKAARSGSTAPYWCPSTG